MTDLEILLLIIIFIFSMAAIASLYLLFLAINEREDDKK